MRSWAVTMGREAGFGVNRLSTKRVHHTAKNARFHGYRMDTAPAKQVLLLLVRVLCCCCKDHV